EHRDRVRDRPDRAQGTLVDSGGSASGPRQLRRPARGCGWMHRGRQLAGRRSSGAGGADERGRAIRAVRPGVSVAERRRVPPVPREREPSSGGLVGGRDRATAGLEARRRNRSALRVTVSGPAEIARGLDDRPAVVVLALPSEAAARVLEALRGAASVEAVVLLSSDPAGAFTPQARRLGVRAVLPEDATAEA